MHASAINIDSKGGMFSLSCSLCIIFQYIYVHMHIVQCMYVNTSAVDSVRFLPDPDPDPDPTYTFLPELNN